MNEKLYFNILSLFLECMDSYTKFESTPRRFGTEDLLYSSEIHTLQMIGTQESCNLTKLAGLLKVSKSGISKFTGKLLDKRLITKETTEVNRKEVIFKLTPKGKIAYLAHEKFDKQLYTTFFELLDNFDETQSVFLEDFFLKLSDQLNNLNKRKP